MSHTPARPVPATLLGMDGFHRLTVQEYRKMLEAGIFHSGQPVELLEGLLVN